MPDRVVNAGIAFEAIEGARRRANRLARKRRRCLEIEDLTPEVSKNRR